MFLATTALSEFWDNQEEILFLGSWCLRYHRRPSWNRLRYEVLPSPWNDRERFYRAAHYLDACNERMLVLLSDHLNALHGIQTPPRYWRILIGPWLIHHLHVLYDRYIHLQEAFKRDPSLTTLCLEPDSFQVPQDATEHAAWILEDRYNLQLYSELLTRMGYAFPSRKLPVQPEPSTRGIARRKLRAWVSRHLQDAAVWPLKRRWKIALYETALPRASLCKIAWSTGLRALPLALKERWPSGFSKAIFNSQRALLAGLPFQDEFERIFVQMLPQGFPSLYLEGYPAAREETLRRLPSNPSVIVSAIGWHFHEPFQWAAAEAALKGRRLVALQHGGGYGVYRFTSPERHERHLSDSYFVWGWANQHGGHSKNVPAPQLAVLARRSRSIPSQRRKPILFVATTNPPYFYRFVSAPQGSLLEDYFQWQHRFFQASSQELRARILFRPQRHPPCPCGVQERLLERFPDLRWDNGSTFHQSVRQSSLIVMDHLGTPVLETLAANWPTLLFWDPQRWEVREEAKPYFDALREAGILSDSPEAAAGCLAKVADALPEWWANPKTQEARRSFVDRYAHWRSDWPAVWRMALAEEVSEAPSRP